MKTMKNSISTAVSIIALVISMLVIGPDRAMAKDNKQRGVRSTSKSRRSSSTNRVRRSSPGHITDGTSNTMMFGEVKGVISPRDAASGLPTGIVSGNRATTALRGRGNHHPR